MASSFPHRSSTIVSDVRLIASRDVVSRDGALVATTREPWLDLDVDAGILAGRWVEITYRASAWDEPARPVFRFHLTDGRTIDRIGAAPIVGTGVWSGRIPSGTRAIGVSPTNRPGVFGFVVDGIRPRWWSAVVAAGLRKGRKSARSALLTRLIGWSPESDVNLGWATGSTPLSDFAAWHHARRRPLDVSGLDAPRFDWTTAPPIALVVVGDLAFRDETIASLTAQKFDRWVLVDPRSESPAEGTELVGVVHAGDRLPPTALAYLSEQARRRPDVRLFYGDTIRREHGRTVPAFKPGWSPKLQRASPYIEGSVFVRGIDRWTPQDRSRFLSTGRMPASVVEGLAAHEVMPLRRIMAETDGTRATPPRVGAVAKAAASATIVIPTRDHPALLRRIVTSIRSSATTTRYDVVVVDNGSVSADAKSLNAELTADPWLRVLDHPGPFNFSAMCNEAASRSSGDVLVFLNDDMEIISEDWLDRLVAQALDPTIGAVGARLTYPDGRIQHIGVLVGMGGSAGHFGALAPGDDPGWAGRNLVAHEVSAVTGACLAVEREKFEAVGGFDAASLPIELSDIDLCLKLAERGWKAIVDPSVHLMHEESASRGGATLRRLDVYGGERTIFIERWRHVLRDDPTFHPGLSLYDWRAALG